MDDSAEPTASAARPVDAAVPAGVVAAPLLNASEKRILIWLVAVSFFMQMLDSTIVNTATPSIALGLHTTPLSLKTALTSYALSLAIFIPLSSWMADRYGTRRIFWIAILVFTLGSLGCGMAWDLWSLVGARVVQGFGGAMMLPVGRLALVRSFDKHEFVDAMSFASIPGLIGPTVGPLLGGLFSTYLSWRMIFLVNLPFGIIGLFLARRYMPDYRGATRAPLDLAGFVIFAAGIASLLWAVESIADDQYRTAFASGVAGGVLIAVYTIRSLKIDTPVFDLRMLRIRSFRISFDGGFATRLGVGGMAFLLTLLFQIGFGYSPVMSGVLQMPQALAMLSMRFFVGRIIRQQGYRTVLMRNTALAGVLIVAFSTFNAHTPIWLICAQVFAFGFVMSLQYSAMNTLGFVDLKPEQASMGSSMSSTVQNLSMSFGIAFASLLMAIFLPPGAATGDHYIAAFHSTVLVLGCVTILSALLFVRLPRAAAE
ncbi:MAG TPA: MFS transporter [Rudaea sp.]